MKALYNLAIITLLALLLLIFGPVAWGGGVNRIGAIGPSGIGNGSDPDGPWLPENLAGKIQLRDTQLEVGAEAMFPKFTYTNIWGIKRVSKNVAHVLPYVNYGWRYDENTVVGVEIATQYGIGASFEQIFGTMDSQTLVSGTYVKPFIARRLNDQWSVGAGLILADAMMTWHGPLDVWRLYLPLIDADTRVIGFGVGAEVGVFYQPTDNLAFGIDYMSPVEAHLSGRTEIIRPFHFRDSVKASYRFPDRLEVSGAWKATDRLLVVADWTWYGYSQNSLDGIGVKFNKLMFTKTVKNNWTDNWATRLGASYKLTDRLTIGGGVGYMSKAIPDETADFMTPDVAGLCLAGRLKCKVNDSFDITAGLSRGWGGNKADGREMTADLWTAVLTGTIRF